MTDYFVPEGKYTVWRYAEKKIKGRWTHYDDEVFKEEVETKDEKHVSNLVNGCNPFSSKEIIKWDEVRLKGKVISVSPDGTRRHCWEITREGK